MASDRESIKSLQLAVGSTPDGIWGPNTAKAVAKKLGCAADIKSIQETVGTVVDGILGPNTIKAISVAVSAKPSKAVHSVFIDAGHTADYEREHISQFSQVDWTSGKPADILRMLGMSTKTADSLEHRLNVCLANKLKDVLVSMGFDVVLYDSPQLSNSAEIRQVYTRSNAFQPDVFISIHNNAQGGKAWRSLGGTASGTVGLYNTKSTANKRLANSVTESVNWYRKSNYGQNNRASSLQTSTVGVLSNASQTIPACLIEVGFYDNLDDLYWMTSHMDGIARAMADGIQEYLS